MGKFIGHEPCPSCGSRDNLGRYDDGSAWCFGCGYREKRNRIPVSTTKGLTEDEQLKLPTDLCNDFPGHVVGWLARYNVSVQEAIKHGWKYSPYWDQLVFSFYDKDGNLACSQARNFREGAKSKYYNQGSPSEVLPIFRTSAAGGGTGTASNSLVVVEDAVSALRVATASTSDAMPCLGSYLPAKKLAALKALKYEFLTVWLDADKLKEAREISTMAKWLGFSSKVVHTELDPKEYLDKEINEYLRLS